MADSKVGIWEIAHDLKNSFTLMANAAESLQRYLVPGEASKRSFTELKWFLAHVDHLATSLLDGLRLQAANEAAIRVDSFIRERETTINAMLPAGISMFVRLSSTGHSVVASASDLERLVYSLVANACHAMPAGGELTIGTGRLDHVAGVTHPKVRPRRYVRLTVSDTGDNGDRDLHLRLLDAFPDDGPATESTRENLVSLVWRLNGWLIVESDEASGARVHVCLPALLDGPEL